MADMSEFRIGKGAEEVVTVDFMLLTQNRVKTARNKIWYLINNQKTTDFKYLGLDIMKHKR